MKKLLKIILTAALFTLFGTAFSQEADSTSNEYNRQGEIDNTVRNEQRGQENSNDESYTEPIEPVGIPQTDRRIAPPRDSVHRQAQEDLSEATDTLDQTSYRNTKDKRKVGKKIQHMGDSVDSKMHKKDKDRHGMTD